MIRHHWTKQVLITIAAAVAILALSLYEGANAYQLRAESFHQGAIALRPLMNRARRFPSDGGRNPKAELDQLEAEYDQVLREFRENHETIDWERFRARRRKEFSLGRWSVFWLHTRWWTRFYLRYVLIVVVPPLVVWLLLSQG